MLHRVTSARLVYRIKTEAVQVDVGLLSSHLHSHCLLYPPLLIAREINTATLRFVYLFPFVLWKNRNKRAFLFGLFGTQNLEASRLSPDKKRHANKNGTPLFLFIVHLSFFLSFHKKQHMQEMVFIFEI